MEPAVGFEPTTDGLQNRCSTTELNWPKTGYQNRPAPDFSKRKHSSEGQEAMAVRQVPKKSKDDQSDLTDVSDLQRGEGQ